MHLHHASDLRLRISNLLGRVLWTLLSSSSFSLQQNGGPWFVRDLLGTRAARFKRICHIHPNGKDYLKAVGGAQASDDSAAVLFSSPRPPFPGAPSFRAQKPKGKLKGKNRLGLGGTAFSGRISSKKACCFLGSSGFGFQKTGGKLYDDRAKGFGLQPP